MNKYEEALNYFLYRDDGENITVTCDWLAYAEELKELVERENKNTEDTYILFRDSEYYYHLTKEKDYNERIINTITILDLDTTKRSKAIEKFKYYFKDCKLIIKE